MVVCGDYSSGMYGFLVKGCKKCLLAGLHPDSIRIFIFREVEKIFGEIKAEERKRKGNAIQTFVARMRDYFATIGQNKSSLKFRSLIHHGHIFGIGKQAIALPSRYFGNNAKRFQVLQTAIDRCGGKVGLPSQPCRGGNGTFQQGTMN